MNRKIQVFKEEPGFLRLFQLFKEKYRSLGRVGGSVSLNSFNKNELESIAGFLGVSPDRLLVRNSVGLIEFEKELANTGYANYTLLKLLEEVLGEPIHTKKEEAEQEQQLEALFFDALLKVIPASEWWLRSIQSKSADTRWIWALYRQNKEDLYKKMIAVFHAFSALPKPGEYERLPFFSQRTTGNPHYFDSNEAAGKLLLHCMYSDQVLSVNSEASMPRNTEELNELLAEYGIMRDDLWNFATCQGLLAARGSTMHPVWEAAVETQTVMNVPMKELNKMDRVWPAIGSKVWIVENSSVCSTIMDAVPAAPIICTHGQLRLAGLHLLDLLVRSGCTLYYSGDLDPEGILIAERLKKRYQSQLVLWRMDKAAYEKSLSGEDITARLAKLESISSSEWEELIGEMREKKKAGYQEAIVSLLIGDINEEF